MSFVSTDSQNAESHTWLTPLSLIKALGEFDLDPCAYPGHLTAKKIICLPDCGLKAEWSGRVWLNPPYGKHAEEWVTKLRDHNNGIALLFNRIETKWMRPFLRGGFFSIGRRISFGSSRDGYKGNAGTGSILIPFGEKNIEAILNSGIDGDFFQMTLSTTELNEALRKAREA